MGSGEADGVKIYDVSVVHTPQAKTNHGDWTAALTTKVTNNTSSTSMTVGNISWGDYVYPYTTTSPTTYYYSYPYTKTVYMYQIRCPRCRKMNWCEMDNIVSCKKCSAQIRAVSKRVDFDVEVDT